MRSLNRLRCTLAGRINNYRRLIARRHRPLRLRPGQALRKIFRPRDSHASSPR
jgi:hypothetical protein